jgi:hypothetical protein
MKEKGVSLISNFKSGIVSKVIEVVESVKSMLLNLSGLVSGKSSEFYSAGSNLMSGFINGIKSMSGSVSSAVGNIASSAASKLRSTLQIKSPSRVAAEIGMYFGEGFVEGIQDTAENVTKAVGYLGDEAAAGLKKSFIGMDKTTSAIADAIDSNIDLSPTIRPVLDLTEIQNGSSQLASYMDGLNAYDINGSINTANTVAETMRKTKSTTYNDVNQRIDKLANGLEKLAEKEPVNNIQNTFNITGNDPKEIAEEISKHLQRQVERRGASWGNSIQRNQFRNVGAES